MSECFDQFYCNYFSLIVDWCQGLQKLSWSHRLQLPLDLPFPFETLTEFDEDRDSWEENAPKENDVRNPPDGFIVLKFHFHRDDGDVVEGVEEGCEYFADHVKEWCKDQLFFDLLR